MLIELEGTRPHEEDEWAGRLVQVGDAVLRGGGPVGRCANTTYDPDTGLRDFDTLRALKEYRGQAANGALCLGVYAEVERPGRVRLRDEVTLLDGGVA